MTNQQSTLRTIAFFAPIALATGISIAVGAAFLLIVPERYLRIADKPDSPRQ